MKNRTKKYLTRGIPVLAVFVCVFTFCFAVELQAKDPDENSQCYVCHPALRTEEVTVKHFAWSITCDKCHGSSTEHMHDEMLMTQPDLLFGRSEVRAMCSECHRPGGDRKFYGIEDHDSKTVEEFIKSWRGRIRPNGRAVTKDSICTDCHGTHNIAKGEEQKAGGEKAVEWAAVFNGNDLKNWQSSGNISWTVKRGRIVATPGSKGKGGVLWTKTDYEDYLMAVTFRAEWPIHAGIWLRGSGAEQDKEKGARIEIFESDKPMAFTGSVSIKGKGLALSNLRDDLVDKGGWNTLSVKVQGDRIQVWLNAEEIGVVRAAGAAKGKIGLFIEGNPISRSTELQVREVQIQQLKKEEEEDKK